MPKREWKHGARGCWWAIVKPDDPLHPLPWCCGSTRTQAWAMWREWLGSHATPEYATKWKAVKVFLCEVPDAP